MPGLPQEFRQLLPRAISSATAWAQSQYAIIMRDGRPLTPEGIKIALAVGVKNPQAVRIALVASIPQPTDPLLVQLGTAVKYITPDTRGIAFGHGIFLNQNMVIDTALVAHELTHVSQYERLGGIPQFVAKYCQELMDYEYFDAPLEVEAREREKAFVK